MSLWVMREEKTALRSPKDGKISIIYLGKEAAAPFGISG